MSASVQSKVAIAFFLGLDCCWLDDAGEVAAVPMERQREAERARPAAEMRAMDGKAIMEETLRAVEKKCVADKSDSADSSQVQFSLGNDYVNLFKDSCQRVRAWQKG